MSTLCFNQPLIIKQNQFGLTVNPRMITVPGRILPKPSLEYGKRSSITPRDGSWNLRDKSFLRGSRFPKWGLLLLHIGRKQALFDRREQTVKDLVLAFAAELRKYGVDLGDGLPYRHVVELSGLGLPDKKDNELKLDNVFRTMKTANIPIALVILVSADRQLYSRVKYYGDVLYGIQTVCSVGTKLQKMNGQGMYMANLALKFNIKGGGINHSIKDPMHPLDKDTMLVGIDVTHPSPDSSKRAPSIAGVVANYDRYLCQWPASLRRQEGRVEMVNQLADMISERLDMWKRKNANRLPNKVIVYRDGVSEGQFKLVLEQELPGFQAAFTKHYGDKRKWPKMAIIVVSKRHHTRFYPSRSDQASDRTFNPKAGTVVDRGVTDAFLYDFFLQAHHGLQGTARPARYVVILDELNFQANQLETFTHNMCYLFNRATKAVSICPPAYYADLLCERARMYLFNTLYEGLGPGFEDDAGESEWNGTIHPDVKDTTFYI